MGLEKDGDSKVVTETPINGQMMAEQDEEVYAVVDVVVALHVAALNHSADLAVVATNCSQG